MSKFRRTVVAKGRRIYAALALLATAAVTLPAQTFTTLESLNGTNGEYPVAGLVQAADGNLYGTTEFGGTPSFLCYTGCGTVFKITPSGTLTTLWNFCAGNYSGHCPDGALPRAGLILANNGDLYGTTEYGGTYPSNYAGTIFKISLSGELTTIYNFCSDVSAVCLDGQNPVAGLVQASNGDFYGTTVYGGAYGNGNVFKITPNGALTTLYSFCAQSGCPDGSGPEGSLVQAANGDLYGTTEFGGNCAPTGCGTAFKITPGGTLTTLYSFCTQSSSGVFCTDGEFPVGGLIQAANGYLYGTTDQGGAHGGGTVFKITPSGVPATLTTLYSFCSEGYPSCTDGAYPFAGLVQAANGDLYGTTSGGGANGNQKGTVFAISPTGTPFKTLYSFCPLAGSCTDGEYPVASLVQDTNGKLYGTTENGGTGTCVTSTAPTCGTIFRLSLGLGPFITTVPTAGVAGETVTILGTNLTGATGVTFDGTAATITNNSSSAITTTVPAGASSGTVEVVTPNGTLSSNVTFRVLP
jgi:uncharacterized repeat protein (TIGR03803 family)